MKVIVTYPVPRDNYDTFLPDLFRFNQSLEEFPAGCDYYMLLMECLPEFEHLNPVATSWESREKCFRACYTGSGCDIGSHLHAADMAGSAFLVCLSTRVYFHRAGWLQHLVQARDQLGPGLYGTAISFEHEPHVRTHCFGIDAGLLREYPYRINSRQRGYFFESGLGNEECGSFFNWCRTIKSFPVHIVHWDGVYDFESARTAPNRFRQGDQSNLLVFDRHTKIWEDADPEEKARLTRLTYDPHEP